MMPAVMRNWPKYFEATGGKSKKVMNVVKILEGAMNSSVATLSTDPEVLKNVKRKNVPDEPAIEIIEHADAKLGSSFAEMILCLPGDTKEKHFETLRYAIDSQTTRIKSFGCMLLPGTEMASKNDRTKLFLSQIL